MVNYKPLYPEQVRGARGVEADAAGGRRGAGPRAGPAAADGRPGLWRQLPGQRHRRGDRGAGLDRRRRRRAHRPKARACALLHESNVMGVDERHRV